MVTEGAATAAGESTTPRGMRRALVLRDYGIIGVLVLLIVLLAITSAAF